MQFLRLLKVFMDHYKFLRIVSQILMSKEFMKILQIICESIATLMRLKAPGAVFGG